MISSRHITLAFAVTFNFFLCYNCQFCSFAKNQLKCENFQSFSDLDFSIVNATIDSMSFKPAIPILFDGSLNLAGLNFSLDYIIHLENIKGFSFYSNPDELIRGNFYLKNSMFDFYKDNEKIDFQLCDYINRNEFYISLFDVFDLISLEEGVTFPDEVCPCEFKNAKIGIFQVNGLNKKNKLSFMNIPINDTATSLNCAVKGLQIFNSEIDLDTSLVYPEVFRRLNSLLIQLSNVTSVEENFFTHFRDLKIVELSIMNFQELFAKDLKWIRNLNYGVKVNLSDPEDVNNNKDKQLILELKDLNKKYDYPEKDFCNFQDYPHERLVFPLIETKDNLECTCTLMWLIKNKNLFSQIIEFLNTSSVSNCLQNPKFDSIISECEFNKKIEACRCGCKGNDQVPTNSYETLSTVFIILWVIVTVALCFTLYVIFRYKKADPNFSIGFKPNV